MYFICNVYIYICQHDTLYVSKKLIKVYVYCSLYAQTKIKHFVFVLYNVLLILFVRDLMTGYLPLSPPPPLPLSPPHLISFIRLI